MLPLPPPGASLRATVSCRGVHARHTSPGLQELTKLNAPRRVLGQTRTPRLPGASCPGSRRTTPGREGLDGTGRRGSQSAMLRAGPRLPPGASVHRGRGARHCSGQTGTCCARGFRRGLQGACAACELTRCSSSEDALGNHRTPHTRATCPSQGLRWVRLPSSPLHSPALRVSSLNKAFQEGPCILWQWEGETQGVNMRYMVQAPGRRCRFPASSPGPCRAPLPNPSLWRRPRALGRVLFPDQPGGPHHLSMGTAIPSVTDWEGSPCTLRSCQLQARPSREGRSVNP